MDVAVYTESMSGRGLKSLHRIHVLGICQEHGQYLIWPYLGIYSGSASFESSPQSPLPALPSRLTRAATALEPRSESKSLCLGSGSSWIWLLSEGCLKTSFDHPGIPYRLRSLLVNHRQGAAEVCCSEPCARRRRLAAVCAGMWGESWRFLEPGFPNLVEVCLLQQCSRQLRFDPLLESPCSILYVSQFVAPLAVSLEPLLHQFLSSGAPGGAWAQSPYTETELR